jgi:hypothetical protein
MSISQIRKSLGQLTSFSTQATKRHFDSKYGNLDPKILDKSTQPHKSLQDVLRANLETFHIGLETDQIHIKHLSESGLPNNPNKILEASATENPSADQPFDLLRDLLNYFDKLVRVSRAISNEGQDFMPTVTNVYNDQITYLYNEVFVPIINKSQSVLARIFTHDSLSNNPELNDVLNRLSLDSLPDLDDQSKGFKHSTIYSLDEALEVLIDDIDFNKSFGNYYFQYQVDPSGFLKDIQFDNHKLADPIDNLDETAKYLVAKSVKDKDFKGLDSLASSYGFNPVFYKFVGYKIDLQTLTTFIDNMEKYEKDKLKEQYLPYLKGEKSIEANTEYTTALVLQAHLRPDKGITIQQLKQLLSRQTETAN